MSIQAKVKRVATSTALQGDLTVRARAVALYSPFYGTGPPAATCRLSVDVNPDECGKSAPSHTTASVTGHDVEWDEDAAFELDWPEEPEEFQLRASVFEDHDEKGKVALGSCAFTLPTPDRKNIWRGRFTRRLHTPARQGEAHSGPPPGAIVLEVTYKPANALALMASADRMKGMTKTDLDAPPASRGKTVNFGDDDALPRETLASRDTARSRETTASSDAPNPAVSPRAQTERAGTVNFREGADSPSSPRAQTLKEEKTSMFSPRGMTSMFSPRATQKEKEDKKIEKDPRAGRRRRGLDAAADVETAPFEFHPPDDEDLIGTLKLCVSSAWGLRNADVGSKSDPYCKIKVPSNQEQKEVWNTAVVDDSLEPDWDEEREFFINWHDPGPLALQFEIWDKDDVGSDDLLGRCSLQVPSKTCHIRYILGLDDPKSSPKKKPMLSKFGSKDAPHAKAKPGFQFDLHYWHLGESRDDNFEMEEFMAPNVALRVDPRRLQQYEERIYGLSKRLPLLEKSVNRAKTEYDAVIAEYEELKNVSAELEEALLHNEEMEGHLHAVLMRSQEVTTLIEENTVEDATGARLIGIRPTRPPLLDEDQVLTEAMVWLAFGHIAEPPDYNFAYVKKLEELLKSCREEDSPKSKNSPQSKKAPRRPKIESVLPSSSKAHFNQVLDACNAMQFTTAEWTRLLSYSQMQEEEE